MPLDLIMCRHCVLSRPDFIATVKRLRKAFPNDIRVVELECMAACDDVPAVMIETDYFPRINYREFEREVLRRIRAAQGVVNEPTPS